MNAVGTQKDKDKDDDVYNSTLTYYPYNLVLLPIDQYFNLCLHMYMYIVKHTFYS